MLYVQCSSCRWVQVACPRLSIDWGEAFDKPLLTPYEVSFLCLSPMIQLRQAHLQHTGSILGSFSPGPCAKGQ